MVRYTDRHSFESDSPPSPSPLPMQMPRSLSPPPRMPHDRHRMHQYYEHDHHDQPQLRPQYYDPSAAANATTGAAGAGGVRNRDGFPSLELTQSQTAQLRAIEQRLLEQYLERYDDFVELQQRVVDGSQWKLTRQANGVKAYKRRSSSRATSTASSTRQRRGRSEVDASEDPMLLVVGSIDGTLEDVLYGAVWHSRDERSTRTHFTKDGIVDAAVLYSMEKPSPMDPFRSLAVKWSLKRSMKSAAVIKDRDFVFLGATGTVRSRSSDERIGFELRHSLKIPAFPPITGGTIVRAEIMSCSFFRQMRGGRVEVFHQASFDAGGGLLNVLAWHHAVDTYVGFAAIVECSYIKKLVRAVQWNSEHPPIKSHDPAAALREYANGEIDDRRCGVCSQPAMGMAASSHGHGHGSYSSSHAMERKCALCHSWVCSNCSLRRDVFTPLPGRPPVTRCFCRTCLSQVTREDPTQYVLRELEQFEQRTATEYADAFTINGHQHHLRPERVAVLGEYPRNDYPEPFTGYMDDGPVPPPPPPPPSLPQQAPVERSSESVFFALDDGSPPLPANHMRKRQSSATPLRPAATSSGSSLQPQVSSGRRRSVQTNHHQQPQPQHQELQQRHQRQSSAAADSENYAPNQYTNGRDEEREDERERQRDARERVSTANVGRTRRRHSTAISSTHASIGISKNTSHQHHQGEILLRSEAERQKWDERETEHTAARHGYHPSTVVNGVQATESRRRKTVLGTEPPPPPLQQQHQHQQPNERLSDRRRVSVAGSTPRRGSSTAMDTTPSSRTTVANGNGEGDPPEISPPPVAPPSAPLLRRRASLPGGTIATGLLRPPPSSGRPPMHMPPRSTDIYAPRGLQPSTTSSTAPPAPRQHTTVQAQFYDTPAARSAVAVLTDEELRPEQQRQSSKQLSLLPHPQPQALTARRELRQEQPMRKPKQRAPPPPRPQEPVYMSQYEELRHFYQQEYDQEERDDEQDEDTQYGEELQQQQQQQQQHELQQELHDQLQQLQSQQLHMQMQTQPQTTREQDAMTVNSLLAELCEIARMTSDYTHSTSTSMQATDASSTDHDQRHDLTAS